MKKSIMVRFMEFLREYRHEIIFGTEMLMIFTVFVLAVIKCITNKT